MKTKFLGLKIFIWCEVIVALRILLFEIPMFVDKFFGQKDLAFSATDLFMAVVMLVSLFYLFAGLVTLLGYGMWQFLHYLVSVITIFLTFALYQTLYFQGQPFQPYYYLPLIYSILTAWVIFFYREYSLKKEKIMKTVLIVDDDISVHKMLEPVLVTHGYQVITAKTGEEGVQMVRDRKPDIVVLDVILPGMKGRDVCVQIKKDPSTKEIPVLFLTSKDSPDDVQAEIEAGGIGHLTKPINPQYLITQIKRILG